MKIPKEIADKAQEYQETNSRAIALYKEVVDWLNANTGSDGVWVGDLEIVDKPSGENQGEDEYCDQSECGYSGDSFYGTYYHKIEGSDKYLAYNYEC